MRRVFTRDQRSRLLRSRWLFASVTLALVIGALVLTQRDRPALAAASDGATEAVSVANNGGFGNLQSDQPAISATGRFVAFRTLAPLDPLDRSNDNSVQVEYDIYVRDTVAHTTTYLSSGRETGEDGVVRVVASYGDSENPSISADGRYLAFDTDDTTIASTPEASHTVVVCDRGPVHADGTYGQGCTYTTLRADEDGTNQTTPQLSADATRVALLASGYAEIANLDLDDSGEIAPVTSDDVLRLSVPDRLDCADLSLALSADVRVALSANGRYLVRVSRYFEDDDGEFPPTTDAVWVNDLQADGNPARLDLEPGSESDYVGCSELTDFGGIAVSGDGRRVAFVVDAETIDDQTIPAVVHAVDRDPDGDGAFGPTGGEHVNADIVSRDVSGTAVAGDDPSFSTDGRYLAFTTDAPDTHNGFDVNDQVATCLRSPIEIPRLRSDRAADGYRLAPAADTGFSHCDVVVRDLVVDERRAAAHQLRLPGELASPSLFSTCEPPSGVPCEGDGDSVTPVLDADGSAVAFGSAAHDLVDSDENGRSDVFLRRFLPTVTVGSIDFGQVELGAASTAAANVTHLGWGPLPVGPVTVGGTNAGDFDVFPGQSCTGTVLHEEDPPCLVSVRFRPGALGTRTGTLTVTSTDDRAFPGKLAGVGVPGPPPRTPGFSVAPNPLAFGTQPLLRGTPARTVTVTNSGTAPLTVLSVAPVGTAPADFPGDYAITANSCLAAPIAPGATCQVSVVFTAKAVGPRPALLQFTDNALPGPQLVGLTGAGGGPTLTAVPPLAPPGAVSQVTGAGFPAGKDVVLTLDGMPAQTEATANPSGGFTVPLVILPHTAPGKRQLHADVQGVPTPIRVSIDYLVVPGSLQPPDFAERR